MKINDSLGLTIPPHLGYGAQVRRNGQATSTSDVHALHSLIPATDYLAGAEREGESVAPIPRSVKFFTG